MNMSSERVMFTSTVTAFTYQNFNGGENAPPPVEMNIFEHPGAGGGSHVVGPAVMADAELKSQATAAYAEGFAAGRSEVLVSAQQKIAEAKQPIADNLVAFGQERDHYFHAMETEVVD